MLGHTHACHHRDMTCPTQKGEIGLNMANRGPARKRANPRRCRFAAAGREEELATAKIDMNRFGLLSTQGEDGLRYSSTTRRPPCSFQALPQVARQPPGTSTDENEPLDETGFVANTSTAWLLQLDCRACSVRTQVNYKLNLGLVLVGGVHAVQVLIESRDMAAINGAVLSHR